MPIIENLSNPGLKPDHWILISEVTGPDIDFKKISIEKLKLLKLERMLDPIFKISEIASQEYSIELFIKEMEMTIDTQYNKIEEKTQLKSEDFEEIKQIIVIIEI